MLPPPPHVFTGEETASDILRIVLLDDFLPDTIKGARAEVTYLEDVPYLTFRATAKKNLGDFSCTYRLDRMMETVFPECERLYDEAQSVGLVGPEEHQHRNITIRHLVHYAMNQMLHRLLLLQLIMFQENFDETMFMTSGMLIHALTKDREPGVKKAANAAVKELLDKTIKQSAGRKEGLLAQLLNSLLSFHIPTGPGRPPGSTKPEEQKAKDAAEFRLQVENAIRALRPPHGALPTQTAVAKYLGIGGISAKGSNTHLSTFRTKLKRNNLDFKEIANSVYK